MQGDACWMCQREGVIRPAVAVWAGRRNLCDEHYRKVAERAAVLERVRARAALDA